ncbi:MRN complex-interacting protein [Channa argus]|uniref:MRN complex-interacting protein n=1 Tax=Channa argus TaxID=215402 RepID=UPI003522E9D8
MVQEFHVVRCFKCQIFQVQQVKKATRWSCKLCGEKQSLLKEFGRGSGADCRRHVQKLNAMRGAIIEEQKHFTSSPWEQVEAGEETNDQVSRWSKYLDPPEKGEPDPPEKGEPEEEQNVLIDRQPFHNKDMTNRKRKRSCLTEESKHIRATSPHKTSPPYKKIFNPPILTTLPVSRWAGFLTSDCKEGKGPSVGGVTNQSCCDTIHRHPTLHHISSMFESGDDFSVDDKFLTE